MIDCFLSSQSKNKNIIPLLLIIESEFQQWLTTQPKHIKNLTKVNKFSAKPASFCLITNADGELVKVLVGIKDKADVYVFGVLALALPTGKYMIAAQDLNKQQMQQAIIWWGLGSYKFIKYKSEVVNNKKARLIIPAYINKSYVIDVVNAVFLVRDLINTPTENMSPANLAEVAVKLAHEFGAKVKQVVGNELLKQNFPAVHTVGRASSISPRLIEITWGKNKKAPRVVLVGKGVCFDSGGLNLKTSVNMKSMKMDMAGAAHVLGLARLIMSQKLSVNLKVIIPAVENLISGCGYKPGDVIKTRKGTTVEIHSTDAEGRLILADALTYALEFKPNLLIDFASLTGAASVALGDKITAMFTDNDELANELMAASTVENDPVWRMPLYMPYRKYLNSKIADIANASLLKYGGAITAALFLKEFIVGCKNWVHFDISGVNEKPELWQPEGGEANFLRAMFSYLVKHYS
jgi:leucyl aminopeptidase